MNFIRGLKRHRAFFLFGGAILATILSYLSDPDSGMATAMGWLAILQGVWAVGAAHWGRKALMDYPEADMRKLFAKASQGAVGSGLALIAIAIMFVGLLVVFAPRAHAETLPAGALKYGPMLKAEQQKYWPDHPRPEVLAALVEQESCISLTHSKCWSPKAQLKTAREEGAGVGQVTRAYRKDGTLRFDTLADMRSKYAPLADWNWQNVYDRPDLQLRALVLLSKESNQPFRETPDMLAFGDAGYNGGVNDVKRERRACALSAGCDPRFWFDNVERHCLKSKEPIYGKRSACDINRGHVAVVIHVRPGKYRMMMVGRF